MPTIENKTPKPLRVPLPRGKVLHLGPRMTGQITPGAADHPPLAALVAAGTLELVAHALPPAQAGGGQHGGAARYGHASASGTRRTGDR